jgi:hypothetical protein
MAEQKNQKTRPVCPEHWQKLRKKGLEGLSFWAKLFASGKVNKVLREQGFVESKTECRFCKKKPYDFYIVTDPVEVEDEASATETAGLENQADRRSLQSRRMPCLFRR